MSKPEVPLAQVLSFEVPATRVAGHRVGVVAGFNADGLHVDYPDNPHGPLAARLAVSVDAPAAVAAAAERRQVLLVFEHERSDQPIIVGFIQPVPLPLDPVSPIPTPEPPAPSTQEPSARFQTVVDGQRLILEAKDEIVLRCGEASITLRRNGRLAIRGAFIETRARGVNRIKGGSVQIN